MRLTNARALIPASLLVQEVAIIEGKSLGQVCNYLNAYITKFAGRNGGFNQDLAHRPSSSSSPSPSPSSSSRSSSSSSSTCTMAEGQRAVTASMNSSMRDRYSSPSRRGCFKPKSARRRDRTAPQCGKERASHARLHLMVIEHVVKL